MTGCYRKSNSTTIGDTSYVDAPCSAITTDELNSPCCPTIGYPESLCLSYDLCWWSPDDASGATGYVAASCTDSTYESSECTEHCTDNPVPDVIYNPDTGLWACCGWDYESGTDCSNPTDETFYAPAPSVLMAAASISSSITGTATSSSTSSTSTSSSTTTSSSSSATITSSVTSSPTSSATSSASSSSSSSSSGLSAGAEAGIAIGAVLGALIIVLAIFFAWRRSKKSRARHGVVEPTTGMDTPPYQQQSGYQQPSGERKSWRGEYRDHSPPAMEMHANSTSELPTTAPTRYDGRNGFAELQ